MVTALQMNIGSVTLDLYAKYTRNRTENEHRVCNLRFICRNHTENEHRVCNLRFVFEVLKNRNENEHRVCNLGFVCEKMQKSHETRT